MLTDTQFACNANGFLDSLQIQVLFGRVDQLLRGRLDTILDAHQPRIAHGA